MTGKQILSLMRDRLREVCPDNFTDSYLIQELNAAQNALVARTKCLVDSANINTFEGVQKYQIPTDCMRILHAEYDGKRLTEHAISTILDSEAASGMPYAFGVFADEIWLYPTPAETGTLRIYYLKRPAAIAIDSLNSAVDLTDEWCEAAVNLALANVLSVKGDERAPVFMAAYDRACAERRANTLRRMPDRMGIERR
ncbi:MAG: hypothetical protein HPY52_11065 [Firmicutes bacterium]|nr:hypothetical protein [Bacillota bacterium]